MSVRARAHEVDTDERARARQPDRAPPARPHTRTYRQAMYGFGERVLPAFVRETVGWTQSASGGGRKGAAAPLAVAVVAVVLVLVDMRMLPPHHHQRQ